MVANIASQLYYTKKETLLAIDWFMSEFYDDAPNITCFFFLFFFLLKTEVIQQ